MERSKKGHETFYTTLNQLSDVHSAECITRVRANPFLSRNGRFSSVNTPFHLVMDIYCLTQGPGSDGDARPYPANGAAATPLWLSKHLKRANLDVTNLVSFACFSIGVHSLSSRICNVRGLVSQKSFIQMAVQPCIPWHGR